MNASLSIAVILFNEVNAIDVAEPIEAFGSVRTETDEPAYTIDCWALGELAVRAESALKLCADRRPPERPFADILIVPGGKGIRSEPTLTTLAAWLRALRSLSAASRPSVRVHTRWPKLACLTDEK